MLRCARRELEPLSSSGTVQAGGETDYVTVSGMVPVEYYRAIQALVHCLTYLPASLTMLRYRSNMLYHATPGNAEGYTVDHENVTLG